MNKKNHLPQFINDYFEEITRCLQTLNRQKIQKAIDLLAKAYQNDKKIFILGNGGSASTAGHICCDFNKGTLKKFSDSQRRFQVISLSENLPLITAYANDLSYDEIFVQQLKNLVSPGDLIIVISASGNSPNIVKAVKFARRKKIKTIGLLGFKTGGKVGQLVDCPLIVDSDRYGPVEDIHLILGHLLAYYLKLIKKDLDRS